MLGGSIIFYSSDTNEIVHRVDMDEIGEVADIEAYTHSMEFKDIVLKFDIGRVCSNISYGGLPVVTTIYESNS